MKKAVIVNNWPHQYGGGIESYTSELIKILQDLNFEIFEYSTLSPGNQKPTSKPIKGVKQFDISNGAKFYRWNASKKINKIISEDDFDILIANTLLTKSGYYSKKVVTIQHMDHKFYEATSPQRWFDMLNSLFLGIGYYKNPLKSVNTVFTTKFENVYENNDSFYVLNPLQDDFEYAKSVRKSNEVLWVARHEEPHKGLKHLNKIWNLSKHKDSFRIGGTGPDTNILEMKNLLIGNVSKKEMQPLMRGAGVFILTSNYEALPLTISESLSQGTPVVMFNSFTSAKVFEECDAVKLIEHKNYDKFNVAIDSILALKKPEYDKLAKNGINFVKGNTSSEHFKKQWKKIVLSIVGGNNE